MTKRKKFALAAVAAAFVACMAFGLLANHSSAVDERLAVFIDCEIASHHQSHHSKENFCCLDWDVIGTEQSGSRTTLYMWVLYEEYAYDGELSVEAGAHVLTAITVEQEDGSYRLLEYWEPEDGSYYSDSIKERIPIHLWSKALDSQRYIDAQSAELEQLAMEHFGIEAASAKEG